ncbi:MAG: hypothetical protein FWE10_03465 [Rikenellaceae bacterium]|nr:hypothetical protein [Rikenellaceae bacterium]MCL2693055.1 hypothetical protein [Rikenellaceae bacterium]
MKKILLTLSAMLFAALFCNEGRAQFYDWGQDPARVRWRTIRTPQVRYIFPTDYERNTVRVMHYLDTVRAQIGYGFTHGPMGRMPLVVRAHNFSSNGIVMLAPKRIELIVTPDAQQFAFPWLKQLAVHEYRHAVQYNNLNRGLIRPLGWLLGQQGMMVGLAFMPVWAMEGDAVLAETQMATFGRGVQPSFSIEYRAMALEGRSAGWRTDKFFSGSFKDFVPNHYQLGYQILSWADDHYGENVLNKTSWFASRNPYLIFPFSIGLRKFYGTSQAGLFRDSFEAAFDFWRSLPVDENSAMIIDTPTTSYTWYSSPVGVGERIVALKTDLCRPSRLVAVDPATGRERVLCNTGAVNSPLSVSPDGRIYWTELRRSTFWDQEVYSQLCSYDMQTGKRQTYRRHRNIFFPHVSADGELTAVQYAPNGTYTIMRGNRRLTLPDTITVHGLTEGLHFIGLSDAGMWIGAVAEDGFRKVTQPSYTTVANLRQSGGRLYFNSIASGKDEAHVYDSEESKEYRISTSRYGSFAPAWSPRGIVMTTYTPDGYMLAIQNNVGENMEEVPCSRVPQNVVNPTRRQWPVVNMDEVTVTDTTMRRVRKYRKGLNLFNFHSWAPAYYEADRIVSEGHFNVNFGLTLLSQNNLNSAVTQLSYGRVNGGHNLLHGKFDYAGWAPRLGLEAQWSDAGQFIYAPWDVERPVRRKDYAEITGRIYLPMRLSSGASFRTLTPSIEQRYENSQYYDPAAETFRTGMNRSIVALQYVESRRMSHRDFLPRFGYAARVSMTTDFFDDNFGRMWSAFGRVFLPGLAPQHVLALRGVVQRQNNAMWLFANRELFPRGAEYGSIPATRRYTAATVDYQFPVWHPDGGLDGWLYFRRVRLNPGGDYAQFAVRRGESGCRCWGNVWSYGADVIFDVVPLRLPSNTSSTITVSVRKPSNLRAAQVSFTVSMPI